MSELVSFLKGNLAELVLGFETLSRLRNISLFNVTGMVTLYLMYTCNIQPSGAEFWSNGIDLKLKWIETVQIYISSMYCLCIQTNNDKLTEFE